jgi:predicted ester cyclase
METLTVQQHEISIKNTCVEFMFAYQKKDIDKMLSFCDPGGDIYFAPMGEAGKGKIGELGRSLWTMLIDSFPDIDNTLDAAIAESNDVVRCQVVITGTQVKEFAGIPSKGLRFDSDHIFIFHLNPANKIDSIEVQWDHADFQRQLGA